MLTPTASEQGHDVEKLQERMKKYPNGTKIPNLATQVSLLKTPSAMDAYAENLNKTEQKMGNSGTLAQEIATGFVETRWPGLLLTPRTSDMNHPGLHGNGGQDLRTTIAIGMNLLPTPTVNDMKNASLPPSQIDRKDSIVKRILEVNPEAWKTSQLNPQFVLEMMGFPPNWTELPFQSGEMNL